MNYFQQTKEAKNIAKKICERLTLEGTSSKDMKTVDISTLIETYEKTEIMLLVYNNDTSKIIMDSFEGSPERKDIINSLFNDVVKTVNFYVCAYGRLMNNIEEAKAELSKFDAELT